MKPINYLSISVLFIILLPAVSAWARHDLMNEEVFKQIGWLDKFKNITVTQYSYSDPSIRHTELLYYNPNPKILTQRDFYSYPLYKPVIFFRGADIGKKISAKNILVYFSDEPDWDVDKYLKLSWMQSFSGESQGYRHMYYPALSFHIPLIFYPQGEAPERAEHFYNMSKLAFSKGDNYWGFRFLAMSLHYIEDMSEPYHTRQLYSGFFDMLHPYSGTLQTIKNFHQNYETYEANLFWLEEQGIMQQNLISSLRKSSTIEMKNPNDFAKYIAQWSYLGSEDTMKMTLELFGKKYKSNTTVTMTEDEFYSMVDSTRAEKFNDDIASRIGLFGTSAKSFLEFARRDLELDEKVTNRVS